VFELSLVAFDCEASTTYLRHDLRQLLDPINTTGVRSVGGQTAVQEAQLIGYGDSFSEDTD
jgi:hypothetical protein